MTYLINASNIRGGGGQQVTDSVCGLLYKYPEHKFIVVLSLAFKTTKDRFGHYDNVQYYQYEIKKSYRTLLFGRDYFLDDIVKKHHVEAVLTVFGPCMGWKPRVTHLCGFARSQLLLTNSPYYQTYSWIDKVKLWCLQFLFRRCSNNFYTENPYISNLAKRKLGKVEVQTVTNYYNQIFDTPSKWQIRKLPKFDGCTLLTISTNNPHKNCKIIPKIALYLKTNYPDFKFRFVLTIKREDLKDIPVEVKDNILFLGWVDIAECPGLYQQSDIMFMPSLMECFSATYPEAMRMEVPIVTTDLDFARGLCGNAASYYSAVDVEAAAKAIYKVATDKKYASLLVENGRKQLMTYDSYEKRADKLVRLLEDIATR